MIPLPSSIRCLHRSLCFGRKFYTAGLHQTPLTNEPAWQSMIKNIERYNLQSPLSQSQINENQRFYKIEKTMEQMVDIFNKIQEELHQSASETNKQFLEVHKSIEQLKSTSYHQE